MATVKFHSAIKEIRGTLGDLVFIPRGNGEAVARRKGKTPEKWSENQEAHQGRFAEASLYAKSVQADPTLSEAYADEAKARRLAPYHLALGDFLKLPEVREIDHLTFTGTAGSVISIDAARPKVLRVDVRILDLQGAVLEEGTAEFDGGSCKWLYAAQKDVPDGQTIVIEATVTDRPGHTASKTAFWAVRE